MRAPVKETLAVAFIAVCMLIGIEKAHDSELAEVHREKCHAWWFGGDTTRAGKSIQKVSLK